MILRRGLFLALGMVMVAVPAAWGETLKQSMEGGVDVSITYPGSVISGSGFSVTVLVENGGWEEKRDVRFEFKPSSALVPSRNELVIDRIASGGSFGETVGFSALSEDESGHFLNIEYSQVLVQNNEIPLEPFRTDIAIPITVKDEPSVSIRTAAPESIFTNAEFPFGVEVVSDDIDLRDLRVRVIPPRDVAFRGETLHTFSNVERGEVVSVRSEIITPDNEIGTQYNLPFEVSVTYRDHLDVEKTESKTVQLVLRPRTFMEFTTDGGVWVGGLFIAPYVSIGTIVGIPAGAILSLLIRRSQNRARRRAGKRRRG